MTFLSFLFFSDAIFDKVFRRRVESILYFKNSLKRYGMLAVWGGVYFCGSLNGSSRKYMNSWKQWGH